MTAHIIATPSSTLPVVLTKYFETKTAGDIEGTMAYFSPKLTSYIDATLGWDLAGYDALKSVFAQYMPHWKPPARSYATAILANGHSALVSMTNTPELFGSELRVLAAVDFVDGKIVRWVDYWDSSAFDPALYEKFRTPAAAFPTDLKDGAIPKQADRALVDAATALQNAFSATDATAASTTLHTDVELCDMALRAHVIGRIEVGRYLGRVLGNAPYGKASRLRHVVGGSRGGGFEWSAGPEAGGLTGIAALELAADGQITKLTIVYDSRLLGAARKAALIAAAF